MTIETVFIDFGNVIGFFDHQRAVDQLRHFTDLTATELTLTLYGGPLEDDYETGSISTEEFVRLAKMNARLCCSDDEFIRMYTDIFWKNDEVCDIIPVLASQARLVVASNTNDAHFRKYCEQFADVIEHFSYLCPSHILHARKPHAAFYNTCQKYAETSPAHCLFLDDLPANIEAGERHGWHGITYRSGQNLRAQLNEFGFHI
jgi:putative hydrolase of the HAD superfamily